MTENHTHRKCVVIIDDDDEDVFAVRRAFSKSDPSIDLKHISDGVAAVDYLLSYTDYSDLPDLVLLDIKMPGMNGFEILRALRSSDISRHLPIIMFSTSASPKEIRQAYSGGANAHLIKPNSMSELQEFAQAIAVFWLSAATLPNRG
ncbi:MAG: response regulator [Pseudomonadota bacterium]